MVEVVVIILVLVLGLGLVLIQSLQPLRQGEAGETGISGGSPTGWVFHLPIVRRFAGAEGDWLAGQDKSDTSESGPGFSSGEPLAFSGDGEYTDSKEEQEEPEASPDPSASGAPASGKKPAKVRFRCVQLNGKPVSGVRISLMSEGGQKYGPTYSREDGSAELEVPTGTYQIQQQAPAGVFLLTSDMELVLEADVHHVPLAYALGGILTVRPVCGCDTKQKLKGADYLLTDLKSHKEYGGSIKSDGSVIFSGLPDGTYMLTEKTAPKGCIPLKPLIYREVPIGTRQTVVLEYHHFATLELHLSSPHNEALEGAVYSIALKNEEDVIPLKECKSDDNGVVRFSDLHPGTYEVTQLKAPQGFAKDNDILEFHLSADELTRHPIHLSNYYYDGAVKSLLSTLEYMALYLQPLIPELQRLTHDQVMKVLSDGRANTEDFTSRRLRVETAENDVSTKDGELRFDIRLNLRIPKEYLETKEDVFILIDIEPQRKIDKLPYKIISRETVYGCKMVSMQQGTVGGYTSKTYDNAKKCYTIWICHTDNASQRNSITRLHFKLDNVFGQQEHNRSNYDLIEGYCIYLGNSADVKDDPSNNYAKTLRLLDLFQVDDYTYEERVAKLQEWNYPMDGYMDFEKEVTRMRTLENQILEEGIGLGRKEGNDDLATNFGKILDEVSQGTSCEDAAEMFKVTVSSVEKLVAELRRRGFNFTPGAAAATT